MPIYDPAHPALHHEQTRALEPYLTLAQSEALIRVWNDGWRPKAGYPMLAPGGNLGITAERTSPGGIDNEGVRWTLTMVVTDYGEVLNRKEVDD